MAVILISRQLGSFGNKIAQKLAEELQYTLLSKKMISIMLLENGFSEERGIKTLYTEKEPSLLSSFMLDKDRLVNYIKKIMYEFARQDNVIIMGMGGQVLFQDLPNTLRVRIIAPMDIRVQRIQAQHFCDKRYAMHLIHDSDYARIGFNKYFFNINWEDNNLYDLIINTHHVTPENAIRLIQEEILELEKKAQQENMMRKLGEFSLKQEVLIRILYEEKISLPYMNIEVNDGTVTLTGYSRTRHNKERCEAITRQIPGVENVVNELFIEPSTL